MRRVVGISLFLGALTLGLAACTQPAGAQSRKGTPKEGPASRPAKPTSRPAGGSSAK